MENQYLIDKNRYDEDVKNGIIPEKILIEKQVWGSTLHRSMVLQAENEQLKEEYKKECKRADELEDSYWKAENENKKFKDLLKECESSIQYYQETYGAMDLDTYTLLAKLKEVLK